MLTLWTMHVTHKYVCDPRKCYMALSMKWGPFVDVLAIIYKSSTI